MTSSRETNHAGLGRPAGYSIVREQLMLILAFLTIVVFCLTGAMACDNGATNDGQTSTTSSVAEGSDSGDIEGYVGEEIEAGKAIITVRALQATFQPAMPAQRLSDQTPTAPAAGESFYQAYVRVKNTDVPPLRVDPKDFTCGVGSSVVGIEATRSGPLPRSLLQNTSLDLLLTFKASSGFEPVLIYSPSWYEGTIRVSPQGNETTSTS